MTPTEAIRRRRKRTAVPGKRLTSLELAEVSCVDVPANAGARHLLFKNLAMVDDKPAEDAPPALSDPSDLRALIAERDAQLAHMAELLAAPSDGGEMPAVPIDP